MRACPAGVLARVAPGRDLRRASLSPGCVDSAALELFEGASWEASSSCSGSDTDEPRECVGNDVYIYHKLSRLRMSGLIVLASYCQTLITGRRSRGRAAPRGADHAGKRRVDDIDRAAPPRRAHGAGRDNGCMDSLFFTYGHHFSYDR